MNLLLTAITGLNANREDFLSWGFSPAECTVENQTRWGYPFDSEDCMMHVIDTVQGLETPVHTWKIQTPDNEAWVTITMDSLDYEGVLNKECLKAAECIAQTKAFHDPCWGGIYQHIKEMLS